MSKSVLISSINNDVAGVLMTAADGIVWQARERRDYSAVKAALNGKYDAAIAARRAAIAGGATLDAACAEYPIDGIDNDMRAAKTAHDARMHVYSADINAAYALYNVEMYAHYTAYITGSATAPFLKDVADFLGRAEIRNADNAAAVEKFTADIIRKIGARKASAAHTLATGEFTRPYGKHEFNEMFLRVFCDVYLARVGRFAGRHAERLAVDSTND